MLGDMLEARVSATHVDDADGVALLKGLLSFSETEYKCAQIPGSSLAFFSITCVACSELAKTLMLSKG